MGVIAESTKLSSIIELELKPLTSGRDASTPPEGSSPFDKLQVQSQ